VLCNGAQQMLAAIRISLAGLARCRASTVLTGCGGARYSPVLPSFYVRQRTEDRRNETYSFKMGVNIFLRSG